MDQVTRPPELNTSILPVFQQYRRENESWIPDLDEWSYLNLRADYDLAAAFTKLFWPDFVEVDGCVLLKRNYSPDNFQYWMLRFQGDRHDVELMVNHIHIWDLFLNDSNKAQYSEGLYEYLAEALVLGWKSALQAAYPGRYFVFAVEHDEGPTVSFYQAEAATK